MNKNLGKNILGFNVGDIIKVTCRYGVSFMHIDEIKESDGVTYYYDHTKNRIYRMWKYGQCHFKGYCM